MSRKRKPITPNDLDVIIAMCDELKIKAIGLRENLAPFKAPAPKRGINTNEKVKLVLKRNTKIKTVQYI
jgi:hypothetical protein